MNIRSLPISQLPLDGLPNVGPDLPAADLEAAALATLTRHGRTFRLAGNLLPRDLLNDAATLYAFCRHVDDLADEAVDLDGARVVLEQLRRAVLQDQATHPVVVGFLSLAARRHLDRALAARLIDTMIDDLGLVRIPDVPALLRYAYGAAGTVGLLMCQLLGVRDPLAAPHALDLGVAMQLTNIARDVGEDAQRNRIYLPADGLPHGSPDQPLRMFEAVVRVLDLAELYYESGRQGLAYLPLRSRLAVGAAATVYREIGQTIRRLGPAYLAAPRCVVPQGRRLLVLGSSLPASLWSRKPQSHDRRLHEALHGECGVNATL